VKYQTYVRLLQRVSDDPDVCHWRKKRDESALIANIRAKQDIHGCFPCFPWMHIHEYYFHRLIEMGYDMDDETVRRTAEQLLDYQLPKGGYMKDRCFRCDESILLPSLHGLGMSNQDSFFRHLLKSLKEKQQPDGSWLFRERRSAWYTIEVVAAMQAVDAL